MSLESEILTLNSLNPVLSTISERLDTISYGLDHQPLILPPVVTGVDEAASHIRSLACIPDPRSVDGFFKKASVWLRAGLLDIKTRYIQRQLQGLFKAELQPELQRHRDYLRELCMNPTPLLHFLEPTCFLPEYTQALIRMSERTFSKKELKASSDYLRTQP